MKVREWWMQRTMREQGLLVLAILALVIFGWIEGVIRPGMQRIHTLEMTVVNQRQQLKEMEQVAAELSLLRNKGSNGLPSSESPLLIVQQLISDLELKVFVEQAQSQGKTSVQISFKEMPYENLLHFLGRIAPQGLRVRSLSLTPGVKQGQCQVMLILDAYVASN